MQYAAFKFKLTETKSDEGTFTGWLSVYGNRDHGDDIVERGAFTKTLQEHQNRFPLLWRHDDGQPVGFFDAEDRAKGLFVRGRLLKDEIRKAGEAFTLLKAGILKGLSIGYEAVKHRMDGDVRRLLEIRLREGSLCMFPMNPEAQVTGVKSEQSAAELDALKSILKAATAAVHCSEIPS